MSVTLVDSKLGEVTIPRNVEFESIENGYIANTIKQTWDSFLGLYRNPYWLYWQSTNKTYTPLSVVRIDFVKIDAGDEYTLLAIPRPCVIVAGDSITFDVHHIKILERQ